MQMFASAVNLEAARESADCHSPGRGCLMHLRDVNDTCKERAMHSIIVTTLIRSEYYRIEQGRNHPDFEQLPLIETRGGLVSFWQKLTARFARKRTASDGSTPPNPVVVESV